ncbi:MAG: GGDEF domain-containing protein, partial [Oceanospirillum sp.]|nr:GGDEF domain-containing protein [Oceanospirillum sp.]
PLTGLHNRRAMDRYLESLNHSGTVFSLAILDLDHFKKLNDRHGHSYGDEVLCLYAKQLNRVALACKGLAVRLGGEEFVLLMPMEEEAANELISELASRLKQLPLEHGEVTFSGGLAQRIDGESRDHLLARADQLLYAAKDAGRNRIYASQAYAGEQAELVLTESES